MIVTQYSALVNGYRGYACPELNEGHAVVLFLDAQYGIGSKRRKEEFLCEGNIGLVQHYVYVAGGLLGSYENLEIAFKNGTGHAYYIIFGAVEVVVGAERLG